MKDDRDELLKELERMARETWSDNMSAESFADSALRLFQRARMNGIIRYPVPS